MCIRDRPTPEPDPVQQLLEEMTLEQKVGQLFLVRPDSLDLSLPLIHI